MKSEKEKISKIEISGRLLSKEIKDQKLVTLSEEVSACILNVSPSKTSFQYCLYLTNKDKKENKKWEHLSFDIKQSMDLSHFTNNNVDFFQWFTQDSIYFLEIFEDEFGERHKKNFWKILEQCLYSIIKNTSIQRASLQVKKTSIKYIKNFREIDNLEEHANKMAIKLEKQKNQKLLEEKLTKEVNKLQISPPKIDTIINLKVAKKIFHTEGELYSYDLKKDELVILNKDKKTILSIYLLDSQKFDYVVCTETLEGLLITLDKIDEQINGQILENQNGIFFCWITSKCYDAITGDCLGFSLDKKEVSEKLRKILDKCYYESKSNEPFDKIEEGNKKILEKIGDYTNIDCFSSSDEEKEEKEEKVEKKKKKVKKNRKEILDFDENFKETETSKEKINKFCINSISNDRAFCITDDNQIVIYKANEDNYTFEKLSTMPVIQEYEGNNVSFSQGLLYKSENNMLLLDENNPFVLYQYDLPKEKIISEWKTGKTSISDICPLKRNGQMTDEPLIYGVNPKSVFKLDERVNNNNNIVDIKTYTVKNFANKIKSTNDGQFVTGSKKGELRLYDKMGIKAKNLFSFYGDPIRYIDMSSDNQYLLLTCDKYLLLINSRYDDDSTNIFTMTVKAVERKTPLRLQIKTTDIAKYGLNEANYTAAKFNMNKNGENNIITSLGEYVIIWNYNDIRKGKIVNYKIKKVNDLVIENYFKVGNGNKIILALPHKIRIQNQKKIFG